MTSLASALMSWGVTCSLLSISADWKKTPSWFDAVIKDGTERNIESISLIDAVLPEVIEQRKQGALKGSQLKVEAHGPNGEEGIYH